MFCITCKHYNSHLILDTCTCPKQPESKVAGKQESSCILQRMFPWSIYRWYNTCGTDGRWWEKKV